MRRCLNERALLRVYLNEPTADDAFHLRMCADCAERYDAFVDDLEAIDAALSGTPPPAVARRVVSPWRAGWVPAAALAAAVAVVVGMTVMRSAAPPETATHRTTVSQFAADVSDAVFASAADSEEFATAADAPDLGAALDAGRPCTREQILEGECNDDVSVLLFASD